MDKPSLVKAKIMTKSLLTSDVVRLKFKNIEPLEIPYKIGQFINLKVRPGVYRSYSIFNYDENIHAFEIAAKVSHNGPGANYIKSLGPGSDVEYIGSSGKFLLDVNSKKVYLFATGTGITPFLAFLRFLDTSYIKPEVSLFWGLRKKEDIFLEEIIYGYNMSIPRFEYQIYLSQGESSFQYRKGRIVQAAEKLDYEEDAKYFLCGHPNMVADVTKILVGKGVPEDKILTEEYTWSAEE